jgi:hypothetical protein
LSTTVKAPILPLRLSQNCLEIFIQNHEYTFITGLQLRILKLTDILFILLGLSNLAQTANGSRFQLTPTG